MGTQPVPQQDEVQTVLGTRFDVQGPLRPGAQGAVYHAVRLRNAAGDATAEEVAIKFYLDPAQNERVEREIRTMTEVRHYSLANLYEHGTVQIQTSQYKFVVWELINGTPLDTLLSSGPLQPKVAAIVGRDVASAIGAIWSKRVVHRDVNPKNIMLRANREGAVLLDLGVAKYIDQTTLTAPGLTWGTRGYLSPEQMLGLDLTCQSDVFSLGISIQEALAGRHPTRLDQNLLAAGGPKTITVSANCPVALAALLDRMVSQRPAHRPTPALVAEQLTAIVDRI